MVICKALKVTETRTEKRAMPERTHSRVSPATNSRNASKKTKPTADIIMVTRANVRNSPTGSAAMALNSITVRAKKGWTLRYCPTLVFIARATMGCS